MFKQLDHTSRRPSAHAQACGVTARPSIARRTSLTLLAAGLALLAPSPSHATDGIGPHAPTSQAARTAAPASPREAAPLGQPVRRDGAAQAGTISSTPGTPEPAAPSSSMSIGRTIGALGIVATLIIALALLLRHLSRRGGLWAQLGAGGRAPSGVLEVLGRYPVARGCTLVLLRLDRRILLVSQSSGKGLAGGHAMSTLCEIADPEDVASILVKTRDEEGTSIAKRFQAILTSADVQTARDMGDERDERDELNERDARDARDMRDTRDTRSTQPPRTQPSQSPKPARAAALPSAAPQSAPAPQPRTTRGGFQAVQPAPGTHAPAAAARAPIAPSIDRVRGRVAALRGQGLEVRA